MPQKGEKWSLGQGGRFKKFVGSQEMRDRTESHARISHDSARITEMVDLGHGNVDGIVPVDNV